MSDLVVNVRQVSSYPATSPVPPTANILLQTAGLGGPYISASAQALVSTALNSTGSIGIGIGIPGNAIGGQVFTATNHILPINASLAWNCYYATPANQFVALWAGLTSAITFDNQGWQFAVGTAPGVEQPVAFTNIMLLNPSGGLWLPNGTLTVARDPSAALEVTTMQYVGNHTVASFNGRNGAVQLTSSDIYSALCLDGPIATQTWVCEQLNTAFQALLQGSVVRWNNRSGNVYLMLSDITCVFFQSGQQPITPTPPATSDDYSIANTAWVQKFVADTLTGGGGGLQLATEAWVLANTVNSFNGRTGQVTLTTQDGTNAGLAPINSPILTGFPTAPTQPVGTIGATIATTAYVMAAVQNAVTGVISFNTRTGAIELEAQDIYDAGGALQASPALTGVPTAPTAPLSTATTQIATTAFVMNEVAATTAGVSSFNTRTGAVTLSLADITGAGGAPIASPAFSGQPTTPTPVNPLQANTDIPNTNWVVQYVSLNSVSSFNGRTGAVTLNANDVTAVGGLANPSPALSGTPTAPTAVPGTSSTQLATTAFVQAAIAGISGVTVSTTPPPSPYLGQAWFNNTAGVQQLNIYTGAAFVPSTNLTPYAPLASPALTGVPTAPTAAPNTNTTQLATTQFVTAAVAAIPLGNYLPLTGGSLTGNLTINTNANNGLTIAAGAGQPNARMLVSLAGQQWSAGIVGASNFNIADETNGAIKFSIAPGAGGGINLTGPTTVTGPNLSCTGNINGSIVSAGGGVVNTIAISAGNNSVYQMIDQNTTVRGQLFYEAATGNITLNNAISGAIFILGLGGDVSLGPASGRNFILQNGVGYQNGQTTWNLLSDARIKTVSRPYVHGLQAVLALNPIVYTYKGNAAMESGGRTHTIDTATEYVGLVAQDVEAVMPEMVSKRSGFIDGAAVTDLRDMNTTPLSYALVNAIKELFAMVTALQAAKPA